jgi:hypothetical protein
LPVSADAVDPRVLRDRILASGERPYQGYAEIAGSLALPELPKVADVTSLLTGTTRVRTWYSSPSRWRFDVVSTAGERDVYGTPDGEFTWDYGTNMLTRLVGAPPVRLPRAGDLLPPDLARRVLVGSGDDDTVSSLPARKIAGRSAVGLRLTPTDPATTIGHVDVWAEADTGLPLAVEVTGRGAGQPVLVSQFLEFSSTPPAAEVLTPKAPPGGGFSVVEAPDIADALGVRRGSRPPAQLAGRALQETDVGVRGVGVYGTGLSAFVALPIPREIGGDAADAVVGAGGVSSELPGGEAFHLSIAPLSVVVARSQVARRWYLLAGLVTSELLLDAAADLSLLPRSGP